ncbi:hypothetical protein ABG768_019585 [Culter alburnus]|uniref:Ig-like domain-containing protein n=1 Tax=Culter alburnus TaxID=194366 RepID=A0AAW2AXG8_CULAL
MALLSKEEGDGIVLECQLKDYYPNKVTVQWFSDNQPLTAKNNKELQNTDKAEKSFTYISQISIGTQYEDKRYTCKATHETKEIKEEYSLCKLKSVLKPSIEVKRARLEEILKENKVKFSCTVKAPHTTTVSWLANGVRKGGTISKEQPNIIVNNLTLTTSEWSNLKTIACTAKHPCFPEERAEIPADDKQKDPVVVIRRPFQKSAQSGSALLECVVKDLSSGDVCIKFQANNADISGFICTDCAPSENTWSLTTPFTIPAEYQKKENTFTCTVYRPFKQWKSQPTGNIFDDPTIELVVVPSVGQSSSEPQKLLCSGEGFDPKIKWISKSMEKQSTALDVTMMENGRVKVYSEISVPQTEWNQEVTYTCQIVDGQSRKTKEKDIRICGVIAPSSQKAAVYLLGPSQNHVRSGAALYLTCLVVGQSVKHFSIQWKVNGTVHKPNVYEQNPTDHANGTQSKKSILEVSNQQWNAYALFSCEVKHLCSTVTQQQNISKTREPKQPIVSILRPSDSDLSGPQNTNLLCFITGFFPSDISVEWQLNGTKLVESHFTNSPVVAHTSGGFSMHSALILPASQWKEGVYSCIVSHESCQVPITATLENLYASVIPSAPSVELLQSASRLVCLVYGFSPSAINITWLLGTTEVSAQNDTNPAKGPDGKFSIRSYLQIQPASWAPGEVYSCRITHATGTQSHNISKSAMFEEAIFMNENKPESITQDTVEEAWNMACAFLTLFLLSLLYGCTVTLVKVKPE